MSAHYRYFVREMRIIAYSQLLESYRSLSIESMARSFGVSEVFIDVQVFFIEYLMKGMSQSSLLLDV